MFFSFLPYLFLNFYPKRTFKMEDDDRRQILDNIDKLITVTKFENLIKKCETKKILTKNMADDIKVLIIYFFVYN